MNSKEENLRIIYNETVELLKLQHGGIDLLYNKLNWILVSNLVFLAAIYNTPSPNMFVILAASSSVALTLISFRPEKFNFTAQITGQLKVVENPNFLKSLIKKKVEAYNSNIKKSEKLHNVFLMASLLLIGAIAIQFLVIYG